MEAASPSACNPAVTRKCAAWTCFRMAHVLGRPFPLHKLFLPSLPSSCLFSVPMAGRRLPLSLICHAKEAKTKGRRARSPRRWHIHPLLTVWRHKTFFSPEETKQGAESPPARAAHARHCELTNEWTFSSHLLATYALRGDELMRTANHGTSSGLH